MTCIMSTKYTLNINGGIHWYFNGKKGLRQGDPLSLLIFVLCIEYLSRIMNYVGSRQNFGYHPRCAPMGLTYLCFVDDLMFFYMGDTNSVNLMIRGLETFSLASGLRANKDKCSVYLGNIVKEQTKAHIKGIIGFCGR